MFGKDVRCRRPRSATGAEQGRPEHVAAGTRPDLRDAGAVGPRAVAGAGRRDRHPRHSTDRNVHRPRSARLSRQPVRRRRHACCSCSPGCSRFWRWCGSSQRFRKPAVVSAAADRRQHDPARRRPRACPRSGASATTAAGRAALAGRALAAMRIIATYAIDRPVGHMPAAVRRRRRVEDGRLILNAGWPRAKRIAVSGVDHAADGGARRWRVAGTQRRRSRRCSSVAQQRARDAHDRQLRPRRRRSTTERSIEALATGEQALRTDRSSSSCGS